MRVTYNWLKQYIDLSDVTPEALAEAVTKGGLEVEGYEKQAYATKLVIGEVLTCEMHPNSDHLHVCTVNDGTGVRQIVCGAPNVAAGQKVIVALPGCQLPGGEIKSGMVRGELSDGMICALFELGVDKKTLTEAQLAGIEILPDDAVVGNTEVLAYLGLDDTIYDVGLTPNRADCYSMWALAKDVAAILNKEAVLPDYSYETEKSAATLIVSSETEKCPVFYGTVVNHVEIAPSPKWLSDALHAAGVKSINNVVDISNYVMLETGQPLHFYDLAKIPAKEITVKTGLNETYKALDGVDYKVVEDDIMITTEGKAIGYAGIMGGDDSKIDEETKGIIIEAAIFNPVCIRNTARRLDLSTEAATRFAKGIDPEAGKKATERSIQLLLELANASSIEETVVYGNSGYTPVTVEASCANINGLLGTTFTNEQIADVMKRLDFNPVTLEGDKLTASIPSYRTDISIWQDLAEEVIRILGYDNIVSTLPNMPTTQASHAKNGSNTRVLQQILNGNGYSEVKTYSLVSDAKINEGVLSCGEAVRIANAMGEDRRFFRTSLLPSLLEIVSYNVARGNDEYALFETANVYNNDGLEALHLSLALSAITTHSKWQNVVDKNDFFTVKGLVLTILDKFGYDEKRVTFKPVSNGKDMLHPNKSADVYLGKKLVGVIGHTHPLCNKKYDIKDTVLCELDLEAIFAEKAGKIKFTPINRFPAVFYDLALVVSEEVTAEQIVSTIKKASNNLLKSVEIFDVYRGVGLPEGSKSVAVSVSYQAADKTLTEADVMPVHSQVLDQLSRKLNASLRS